VPPAKDWLHPAPPLQLMPAGLELTVPDPPTVTCSESVCTVVAKDAPTLAAAVSVIVQLPALPEHAPVQPTNVLPEVGDAVKVTLVPLSNDWVQLPAVPEQLIPAGLEVTVPEPPTVTCSDSS
jgi:phage tail protein X